MEVCLLYKDRDRERLTEGSYSDSENMKKDLNLGVLFHAAGRKLIRERGEVKKVDREDPFLVDTMEKVVMVPLLSRDEIEYRQEIVKDCFEHEAFFRELYRISDETLKAWDFLGRSAVERSRKRSPVTKLLDDIRLLHLFLDSLREIRSCLDGETSETESLSRAVFHSEGLRSFCERFRAAFSDSREESLREMLERISFYTDGEGQKGSAAGQEGWTKKPRIVLECGLEDGLKFSSIRLVEVSSENMRYYPYGSTMKKLQEIRYAMAPGSFKVEKDQKLAEQAKHLEYVVTRFMVDQVMPEIMAEFQSFFDQLRRQTAFYLGALHIRDYMDFLRIDACFPQVSDRDIMEFEELRELVMGLETRVEVIGNTCTLSRKDLLVVTGANQGGKSTFLRSIGIAQVMMQCGLPVAAKAYRSAVFPGIFVHFTRREDASMNSGRLDEELRRMNRIVEEICDGSLLLLNESFATTTEKEASVIACDITRALTEAGVKILMVTHLLSFAQRLYDEEKDLPASRVEFLSAERKENGRRTFRMIRKVPEMTSFGLDLFEEIVGKGPGH